MSWEDQAECIGLTHLFFDEAQENGRRHYRNLDLIKDLCNKCAVRDRCLDLAITHENSGFWASTTEKERETLRDFKRNNKYMSDAWQPLAQVFSSYDDVIEYDLLLDPLYV